MVQADFSDGPDLFLFSQAAEHGNLVFIHPGGIMGMTAYRCVAPGIGLGMTEGVIRTPQIKTHVHHIGYLGFFNLRSYFTNIFFCIILIVQMGMGIKKHFFLLS